MISSMKSIIKIKVEWSWLLSLNPVTQKFMNALLLKNDPTCIENELTASAYRIFLCMD